MNPYLGFAALLAAVAAVPLALIDGWAGPAAACLAVTLSGLLDALDGAVAVQAGRTTKVGFLLDSALDRLADGEPLWRVHEGEVTESSLDPASLGIARATTEDLRGGDAAHNADVVRRLLAGEQGPVRDAVLLNAGAALAVYDSPDSDVDSSLAAGVSKAADAIDSGAAKAALERWVAATSA